MKGKKNWILAAVLFGVFVSTMQGTIPNAALPQILEDLHASAASGTWILTIYLLLFAVSMPLFGKVGDMIGHQRLYLLSLVAFSVATLFCGLSESAATLIFWRALAGVAIGPSLPAAMAIVSHYFAAEERGKAMGLLGAAAAASNAIGAPLGGFLTQYAG